MSGVDGVLFDIDGVMVTSWRPIAGAVDALADIRARGIRRAFLTNTTSRTCDQIAAGLNEIGFDVDTSEIITAGKLTAEYVRSTYPGRRCWVLNSGDVDEDLVGIERDAEDPEVVILGGAGPEFTHRALSRVVELMLDSVPVVAMHRGMTWATDDGLRIDTGVYLPGMEEVTGASIATVGKPSLAGFLAATELMGVDPDHAVMIGDDLHGDVIPAQRVGLIGVLVRTGKFRQSVLELSVDQPDYVIDSIADLPRLLDDLG